jgi:hypothetical protein
LGHDELVSASPPALLGDLRAARVLVSDMWELVNTRRSCRAAPVLIDLIQKADAAYPLAICPASARRSRAGDLSGLGYRSVVGNALSVVAGDLVFGEIEALARDRRWGAGHPAAAAPAGSGVRLVRARVRLRFLLAEDPGAGRRLWLATAAAVLEPAVTGFQLFRD